MAEWQRPRVGIEHLQADVVGSGVLMGADAAADPPIGATGGAACMSVGVAAPDRKGEGAADASVEGPRAPTRVTGGGPAEESASTAPTR